ncbi:MAG: hypothetical protein WA040_18140 [Anaerolineae bacterium]
MDTTVIFVVMRMFERIVTVFVGALLILLGYHLFLKLPDLQDAKGNVKLPKNVSVYMSNIGPGAFFALFGSIIVAISLIFGMSFEQRIGSVNAESTTETPVTSVSVYGVGSAPATGAASAVSERDIRDVSALVIRLNMLPDQLRSDIPISERTPLLEDVLPRVKLMLMETTWDSERWGDQAAFRAWVIDGAESSSERARTVKPAAMDFFNYGTFGGE